MEQHQVKDKEYILCAAVHYDDKQKWQLQGVKRGFVITGHRHSNCLELLSNFIDLTGSDPMIQGFLTNKNRFIDRIEAAEIAFESGQIEVPVGALMSEHLY